MNKKFWEIKNNKTNDIGEIYIYGTIDTYDWGKNSTTATKFRDKLKEIEDVKTLNLYVNSPGGSVFTAHAIYNLIKRHKANNKTAYVDGIAASAASFVIMAMDKVVMPSNAMLMIHNAMTIAWGDYKDFLKVSEDLDKITQTIRNIYAEKTGLTNEEITQLMDEETWLNTDEALEFGFVDEISEEKDAAACLNFDFKNFKNVPVQFRQSLQKQTKEVVNIDEIVKKVKCDLEAEKIAKNNQELLDKIKEKENKYKEAL